MDNEIEPLDTAIWFDALRKHAAQSKGMRGDAVERSLRHAYHLLQLVPYPLRDAVRPDATEAEFERLLENDAFEAAARALVGQPASCEVSQLGLDLFEARVNLPTQSNPAIVRAADGASALLGAWLKCLLELAEPLVRPQIGNLDPGRRTRRS